MGSVAVLVASGVYLSWQYIRDMGGLVGTAYGTMLITKVTLMLGVLLLGGMNYLTIRHWKVTDHRREMLRRVPVFAEVEAGIGVIILMAAAALTDQPPAVDVVVGRASTSEVVRVFAPKMPRLTPAPLARMLPNASSSLDPYGLATGLQKTQSNFNHNISGIFVIIIALVAFIDRFTRTRWTRHWPLLFLSFAVFLLVFSEPTAWPLGHEGFWRTLVAPDVLMHRLATLLVVALAIFEWRVRAGGLAATRWRYVFPVLCAVGGVLLLTHSHSLFAIKSAFLIEDSHNAIGTLAVLMGAGRWLELRMQGREGRVAGLVWPVCFLLVGLVLLFYRET
jgi:putative copper resistance protein D